MLGPAATAPCQARVRCRSRPGHAPVSISGRGLLAVDRVRSRRCGKRQGLPDLGAVQRLRGRSCREGRRRSQRGSGAPPAIRSRPQLSPARDAVRGVAPDLRRRGSGAGFTSSGRSVVAYAASSVGSGRRRNSARMPRVRCHEPMTKKAIATRFAAGSVSHETPPSTYARKSSASPVKIEYQPSLSSPTVMRREAAARRDFTRRRLTVAARPQHPSGKRARLGRPGHPDVRVDATGEAGNVMVCGC